MLNSVLGTGLSAALVCGALYALSGGWSGSDGSQGSPGSPAGPPQAEITNGQIRVKLYLPHAKSGYYRGTRFDWSGVIGSLEYKGHNYYGPWFHSIDPAVHDYRYAGAEIIASTCSGVTGPVDEFQTNGAALGWEEAKPGGTFIKIGVGVLRKDDRPYDFVKQYEIVDVGKWSVEKHSDSVEFTQQLSDPSSGYGYVYQKVVRLSPNKPEMILEHRLKNSGKRRIRSTVYNHNFLVLDNQPPGPDFSITFPFAVQSPEPAPAELAQIRGKQIVYTKALQGQDLVEMRIRGFGSDPQDNQIRIENRKVGAGMNITGDRPLVDENLWSIRTVLAIEPFIAMAIEPGHEFAWKTVYEYYVMTPGRP